MHKLYFEHFQQNKIYHSKTSMKDEDETKEKFQSDNFVKQDRLWQLEEVIRGGFTKKNGFGGKIDFLNYFIRV